MITGVHIFDGTRGEIRQGHVLIAGSKIAQISSRPVAAPTGAKVIDGGGRVLTPGLTDAHWHMVFAPNTMDTMVGTDTGLMYAAAVAEANRTLLRGFTAVRDTGGPTFGLKAAIDKGVIPGPRVYPSGALISQTGGHGDFGPPYGRPVEIGGTPSRYEEIGAFTVANGVSEVIAAVRAQLKAGASQIKLALGGGVISASDPIDTLQFTPDEIRAAVQVASDWGTYVAAHVYTVKGVRRAIDTGVLSIEHGHLLDEDTVALMAARRVWLSLQPFQPGDNPLTPEQETKAEPTSHWDRVARWAVNHGTKVAFGTDLLFQPDATTMQLDMLARFAEVFGARETLRIATSSNCELFALSGRRNPYNEAKLGVIEEGAWADLLIFDGDPTEHIEVVQNPEENLCVVIKNGHIHKNLLA
ncbi:amidohydrolase family protein [Dactylosporangium sp. CA-152071]|uniref:metal-dependent hydrolase family protein n=1 Tax=Dactylosporangium sp. CA-152071 TaxID=3239933 RepID=UPI003D8D746B